MISLKLKAKNHNMPDPYLSITRPHSRFHGVENDWFIDDLIVSNFPLLPHLYQLIEREAIPKLLINPGLKV